MRTRAMVLAGLAALAIGSIAFPSPAQAASTKVACAPVGMASTTDTKANRAKTVNDAIVGMLKQGKSTAEIGQRLQQTYGVQTLTSPDGEQTATPMSAGTDISLAAPQILYDSCGGGWYAYASYHWNSTTPLVNDNGGCLNDPCAVGGVDGFGLTFSRNVASVRGYFMQTWGLSSYYPVDSGRTWASDANTYGVTFEGQDKLCRIQACNYIDYNFYNGELFYNISSIGCGTIQAFSKYGHDWSSTTINGFGVGPWSLSLSWSSSSNRWERSSSPSNAVTPC